MRQGAGEQLSYFGRRARLAKRQSYARTFSGMDREAVGAANAFERDRLLFPAIYLLFLSAAYGVAGLVWSHAIRVPPLSATVARLVLAWGIRAVAA